MRFSFIFFLFTLPVISLAQTRSIPAVKINQPIKIDGNLDDAAWKDIEATGDFITSSPTFGKSSTEKTRVKIAYDNTAVYVAAYLYAKPSTIRKQLTARDVISMQDVDYFVVGFDTYHDHQNAFVFRITSAGVQGDARESQNGSGSSYRTPTCSNWLASVTIPRWKCRTGSCGATRNFARQWRGMPCEDGAGNARPLRPAPAC